MTLGALLQFVSRTLLTRLLKGKGDSVVTLKMSVIAHTQRCIEKAESHGNKLVLMS